MYKAIVLFGFLLVFLFGCTVYQPAADPSPVHSEPITVDRATTVPPTPTALSTPTTSTAVPATIASTPIPTLETIIHLLHTGQTVWFAQGEALWRSGADGLELEQLTSDDFLGWLYAPEFGLHTTLLSPDGRWIAHPSHRAGGLRLVDLGTRQERIIPITVSALAWSPDSRWLAYAPADDPTRRLPECGLCLYDLAADTHLTLIPRIDDLEAGSIRILVWSPDGAKLAYGCCFTPREPYEGTSDGRIETIAITNGQRQSAGATTASVDGGFQQLCWTPKGIVTTTVEPTYTCSPSHTDMLTAISSDNLLATWEAIMGDDGNWETTRLFVTQRVDDQLIWERQIEGNTPLRLAWSPDGRYLFFDDSWSDSPIWRLTADGDNLTEIVPDGYLLGIVRRWN